MRKQAAVYCITCIANKRHYVGSSCDIARRWKEHRYALNRGRGSSQPLQRSWTKYGPGQFKFSILELVDDPKKLIAREQHWIDLLMPELNASQTAFPSRLGLVNGTHHRAKISEGLRKRWSNLTADEREARRAVASSSRRIYWSSLTDEERAEARAKRKPPSDETRAKMRASRLAYVEAHPESLRGRKQSPETVAKMRAATLAQWEKSRPERETKRAAWEAGRETREMQRRRKLSLANKGKTLKRATKRKLRAAAQEQWNDPAYRAKHQEATRAAMKDPAVLQRLSESHRGKKLSERQKRKIGKAHRGRKKSPETIAKMREARRLWWQKHKADA